METHNYFNGPAEETVPDFSSEDYAASLEEKTLKDLAELEMALSEDIDTDTENQFKKKNGLAQGLTLEKLPFRIQKADELHNLHTQQLAIVMQIKKAEVRN